MSGKVSVQQKSGPTITHRHAANVLQRAAVKEECQCEDCKKRRTQLQRWARSREAPGEVPRIVYDVLGSSGSPLEKGTRTFMEERFGYDFSRVRVHTDAQAAESARAVNARAYAVGRHVVWSDRNGISPRVPSPLLAHELAHVTQQNSLVDLSNLSLGAVNDPLESEADELSRSVFNSATAARPSRARGRRLPATIRRDVEPDDGRCLAGVLSPMLVGKLAHRIIQADAEAFHEIDIETTIPSKAKSRGVRADLYGVWREDEARARGISFVPNPNNDTPYAVAEIGEIKPVSYSPGGPRHGAAKAQMSRYFSEWKQFSKIPVVPMISLPDMKSRPFLFATNIESTNIGGGLYIYSCSGKADPLRYGQPVAVTNPARALRPTTSEPGATKQQPILNLPAGSRLLVASVAKSIAALQSVEEQGTAAARFVAEHKTEAAAIAAAVALGIATGGLAIALGLVGGEALVGLSALIAVFAP